MKYHFIGICGAGMSAVAKLLQENGHEVTGSDEGFYPPISDYLTDIGIVCKTPHSKENIPSDVERIVIGKHAKLVPEQNEEVREAFASGKKVFSFPEILESLSQEKSRVVVAGSFGKSTCTSLLAWCLEKGGKDPSYFIGALPFTPKTNAHLGLGADFIFEGDEYPSSNWDSRSKFLHYHPDHLLLTALSHDHVNVFPTHDDYLKPFYELLAQVPKSGKIIVCKDDATINAKLLGAENNYITYGLEPGALWSATHIVFGETTTFTVTKNNEHVVTLTTSLLGKHNIQNILGVVAVLLETQKIEVEKLPELIASFKGIVRRLDKKSDKITIPVYEGFGSSYDKAVSAINAIKLHYPEKKLFIIFEPHTFSWRNKKALHWYDTVFNHADTVFIYKPPTHGENTHEQLTHEEITAQVEHSGVAVKSFSTKEDAITQLDEQLTENHVILILSSGDFDGLIPKLVSHLEKRFPLV